MTAKFITRYDRKAPPRSLIAALARQISEGRVAVIPTETQYAMTADATSRTAVAAVRALKGRSPRQPFSVFVTNFDMLVQWRIEMPSWVQPLAGTFWPGPLTLILPTRRSVFRNLGTIGSVGVRISPEPVVQMLVRALNRPLLATSANPSGIILSARDENNWLADGAQSRKFLWARPQRYVRKPPSTVLDCCGSRPKLIRGGAIEPRAWRQALSANC